jgi:hypothetical protein
MTDLAQDSPANEEACEADGDVHDEYPAPADLHEQAAKRRPRGGGDPADCGPDTDRDVALLCRELRQQQAQRSWQEKCRTETLYGARCDQERHGWG